MKRSSTPCRRALSALALVAFAAALAIGCVTRSRYNRDVDALEDERDQLTARVADLERSNEALGGERLKLLDEMESLRVEHEDLSEDVAQLEKTRDLLSTHLREREAEVAELAKRSGEYEGLVKELEQEVSSGQIQITQLREGLRLNLAQDILFRSGSATLEPYGVDLLNKVSEQLAKFPQEVEVQGHTDNVPVSKSSRWGTNWELAAARAASVVRLFEKQGIDPAHLRAVSYGEHAPVDTNATAEGRARNRRIDIRLKPIDAPEEAAAADQARSSSAAEAQPAPAP
jgi:chemotaxis protein MotB